MKNGKAIAKTTTTTAKPVAKATGKKPAGKATAKPDALKAQQTRAIAERKANKAKAKPAAKADAKKPAAPVTPTARATKKGDAIAMLKNGVSLETLMAKFGWQRHTVRGFISILGKTHKIESTLVEGARTYKIA